MQLEIFPTRPDPAKKSQKWDGMTQDERTALVRTLARLMMKVIRPKKKGGKDE